MESSEISFVVNELFFEYFLGVLGVWERWGGDGLFAKAGDSSESYSRYIIHFNCIELCSNIKHCRKICVFDMAIQSRNA